MNYGDKKKKFIGYTCTHFYISFGKHVTETIMALNTPAETAVSKEFPVLVPTKPGVFDII